jgi:hypothetical protein
MHSAVAEGPVALAFMGRPDKPGDDGGLGKRLVVEEGRDGGF